jgi:lipopolysaccharide export system permease protein
MFNTANYSLDAEWPTRSWFRSWRAEFPTSPRELAQRARSLEEMSYQELKGYIADALRAHQPTTEAELLLHHKLSIPFACLVFALVAPPLGMRSHRGSSSIGLGIAILVGFAYYVLWNYLAIVARQGGAVTPFWAAWLPNVVTGLVGVGLILRVRR